MAIDTREKRFSMINFGTSIPIALFTPDGAVDADDRAHLLNLYSGITLDAPPVVGVYPVYRHPLRMFQPNLMR